MIQAHYLNQDFEAAVSEAQRALKAFPDLATAHLQLGLQFQNMGKSSDAQPCFEQALKLDPELVEARIGLGEALLKQGKTEEGLAHFREALEQRPDLPEAYDGLGKALVSSGVMNRPQEMQKAVNIHPDQVQPYLYLSQAYRAWAGRPRQRRQRRIYAPLRVRMEKRDREGERAYVP